MNYIHPGQISCVYCKSSKVHKNGVRVQKKGEMQDWHCQNCRKYFRTPVEDPNSSLMLPEDVEPGRILNVKFDRPIKIHGATDVHFGALEHHDDKFQELIDEVDSDPDARWFLNGDNIELIPPNYKISQRGQLMEPDDQHTHLIGRIDHIVD